MDFGAIVNGTDSLISLSATSLLGYRNATWFSLLILYPVTLLNLCISYSKLLVKSFRFSIYSIMSSAKSECLTSSLQMWLLFTPFCHLIAVTRTFSTMLNKSGESGRPCLVPDLKGKALFFTIGYDVHCGFSYMAFIMLRYIPSKLLC